MRAACSFFMFVLAVFTFAQGSFDLRSEGDKASVMVRAYESTQATQPAAQASWRFPAQGPCTFSYQLLSSAHADRKLPLRQVLLAGIEQYLDQRVHFGKTGVSCDVSDEKLMADMNDMARSIAAHFEVSAGFGGFTEATMEQLERVTHKYLAIYFYVRSQRQELGRQLRADLVPVAAVDLLAVTRTTAAQVGRSVEAPTVCSTVYDEGNFLCALDLGVADTLSGLKDGVLDDRALLGLASQARKRIAQQEEPVEMPQQQRVRKRDRWLKAELDRINERIDQLDQRKELWTLRDRMDDLESRIEDIGLEVQDMRSSSSSGTHDNPIADLSELTGRNITVRFARLSVELDANGKALLNEVFEQLARNPEDRVLITGYTDKSGDPTVNMHLSELRAKAVRDHLAQRGIAAERLLVNFYGDSRSEGRDPEQRRVEVEWLRN
jgi:outer membrane protein OmpA-like peptidoglycan-associated protein